MKILILSVILLICHVNSFGQKDNFYPGYIIQNSGDTIHCEIKDEDWVATPNQFKYRLLNSASELIIDIENSNEINAIGQFKYIRYSGNIDVSSDRISELSISREPQFEKQTIFLEVITEGKASLYFYSNAKFRRFFFKPSAGEIQPLIHKEYESSQNVVSRNEEYKMQLMREVNCKSYSIDNYKNIDYRIRSLSTYFKEYNRCFSAAITSVRIERKKVINIYAQVGYGTSTFNYRHFRDVLLREKHNPNTYIRIGLGGEILVPKTNRVLYFIFEPSFQQHSSTEGPGTPFDFKSEFKYNSLEIPIGLKFNFLINNNISFFLKGLYSTNVAISNSSLKLYPLGYEYKIGPRANLEFAGGLNFKNKLSAEMRLSTNRNVLKNYPYFTSSLTTFEVMIGYRIFKL